MNLKNNLFDFATKELSQDAVICWILNWVNFPESELFELGKQLLSEINPNDLQYGDAIKVLQQKEKADIVVVIPTQKRVIIIEDKVYSTEHDNQIEKYRETLSKVEKQREILGIDTETSYEVRTVYLKTGFFYDNDKLVKADSIIDGWRFYRIISNPVFQGKSEILDNYLVYLKGLLDWYDTHGDYTGRYEDGGYHVSWEQYAQYKLMRFFFPEGMWDGASKPYKVYSDSSSGRPWTELDIAPAFHFKDSDDSFTLFWRIDTATKGPYISFRLYEWFNKSDEEKNQRHNDCYKKLKMICEEIVGRDNKAGIRWEDVNDGYRGNYYESALFTVRLEPFIKEWEEKGQLLAEFIRNVTGMILAHVNTMEF